MDINWIAMEQVIVSSAADAMSASCMDGLHGGVTVIDQNSKFERVY